MNNAIRHKVTLPSTFPVCFNPDTDGSGSRRLAVPQDGRPGQVDRAQERLAQRLAAARARLRLAAETGLRVRIYEVALDLDMSEFHFARQFRAAYGCSPHVFYDEIRAARARDLLGEGEAEGQVARRIGLRRPAELRALLAKRQHLDSLAALSRTDWRS